MKSYTVEVSGCFLNGTACKLVFFFFFFSPYSNWLSCSEGMASWNYYTSSLAWLVWQKSEKIRFITKTAVISFQSRENGERKAVNLTDVFVAYMLSKLGEPVYSV